MPQILMDPESKSLVEEFRPGQGAVQEPSRYPETCVAPRQWAGGLCHGWAGT